MKNLVSGKLVVLFLVLAMNSSALAQEGHVESPTGWQPAIGLYSGPSNRCNLKLYHRDDASFVTETAETSSSGARCSVPGSVSIYQSEQGSNYLSSIDNYNQRYRIQPLNPLSDSEFILSNEALKADGTWVVKDSSIFRKN